MAARDDLAHSGVAAVRRAGLDAFKAAFLAVLPAKALHARRKQTVEPAFGIIESAMGFTCFHLRGRRKVAAEWTLIALACNRRRLHTLRAA